MGKSIRNADSNSMHAKSTMSDKGRNSSIELLRLFAMLMIVGFHFIYCNSDSEWLSAQPASITKFIYQVFLMGGGCVGDFIFFTISTWFLIDRENTLRNSFRRVWILERELLFWSITLFVVYMILCRHTLHLESVSAGRLIIQSLFPLSSDLWWYPTSYALYLLFLPFLIKGTKCLGAANHRNLSIICLALWGIGGLVPEVEFHFDLTNSSVFVFIYWFILISYYRWHMRPFSKRFCIVLITTGITVNILYWLVATAIYSHTGKGTALFGFIFDHWKLPSMMIGFGLFLLFENHHFSSRIVNWIAGSAFGVYLIHYHPISHNLWSKYLPLHGLLSSSHPILNGMICIAGIFLCCLLLDMVRHLLFALTIDRHKGALFERLCTYIGKHRAPKCSRHTQK